MGQLRERQLRSGFVMGNFLGSLDLGFEGSRGVIKTERVILGSDRKNMRALLVLRIVEG